MENQFATPILFVIFNRPNNTRQVFEAIRKIKPAKLYIAADGARRNKVGEDKLCAETRKVVENIDWACEVKRKYSDVNLGCEIGVSSAITWFFENVEQGIILEDDCLPDLSFFNFCQELLERYKDVDKVKIISGSNLHFGKKYGEESYFFSSLPTVWGWATWRRAWDLFDLEMEGLEEYISSNKMYELFKDRKMVDFWSNHFRHVKYKNIDTWDAQWLYAILKNKGVGIMPNVNLISNIGFGKGSTHTKEVDTPLNKIPLEKISTLIHPKSIIVNEKADEHLFYTLFYRSFIQKVISKMKTILSV